jgi:hypothetical protein
MDLSRHLVLNSKDAEALRRTERAEEAAACIDCLSVLIADLAHHEEGWPIGLHAMVRAAIVTDVGASIRQVFLTSPAWMSTDDITDRVLNACGFISPRQNRQRMTP